MRFFYLNPEAQQRVAVVVPLLALAISMFLVYPAWGRYRNLQEKVDKQHKELKQLTEAALPTPGPIQPAGPDQASEPAEFLGLMTRLTMQANCEFLGLENTAVEKRKDNTAVRPVRAKVDIQGRYPAVRKFLSELSRAPRLLVVSDIMLSAVTQATSKTGAPTGLVRATIEVERYVAPPLPVAVSSGS